MDNINDIISSLTPEDIDMLKGVASSILGSGDDSQPPPPQQSAPAGNALIGMGLSADDLGMIMRAKSIFDRVNNTSSKNADLITALKPHLSPDSQQKADQAIRILKLFDILPYIKELF